MLKDANYQITFSQPGAPTGSLNALGNPIYGAATEATILCWLHGVRQNALPPVIQSAGIEVDNHTPMMGFVLKPGKIQSDGSLVPVENVIPDFFKSGSDCEATHIATQRSGRIKLYRRELDMAAHTAVVRRTGVQIYGFLLLQG